MSLDLALPVTWLGIGVGIGVPLGYWIAVTVWRYSHGWAARWMDLREDPEWGTPWRLSRCRSLSFFGRSTLAIAV